TLIPGGAPCMLACGSGAATPGPGGVAAALLPTEACRTVPQPASAASSKKAKARAMPRCMQVLYPLQHRAQLLLGNRHAHAGTLFLQGEEGAEVPALPAALHRLAHGFHGDARLPHRHVFPVGELERERHVLVRQAQAEGRRIELVRQEVLGHAVEGALAAARALAHRLEEVERIDARLHAEREDLR